LRRRDEVVDLFAVPTKRMGRPIRGDGDDDAAFGGAIEFREDDAGYADGRGEFAAWLGRSGRWWRPSPEGCRGRRESLLRRCVHFFEFLHEIGFGVEAAGGVHDTASALRAFAAAMASKTTAQVGADFCLMTSTPLRWAQIRAVDGGARKCPRRRGRRCGHPGVGDWRACRLLVVLPAPFTRR